MAKKDYFFMGQLLNQAAGLQARQELILSGS